MGAYEFHFNLSRPVATAILAAAACISVYTFIRPSLSSASRPRPVARSRLSPKSDGSFASSAPEKVPYPQDVFPGGRDVATAYGSIKVFEWGEEDGEKVVLMHGIGTPCVALGGMAREFVRTGHRVMLFDLFGRGYSEAPTDLKYDDRLYTAQLLLALASSPLPWTGSSAFHLVGYSLGGALAASFTAYHPHLVRSLTLVCPGGLVRPSHLSARSRLLYSQGLFPERLLRWFARRRLQPGAASSADVPDGEETDVDFDGVGLRGADGRVRTTVGEVVKWQIEQNEGFVGAYMSTIRNAPIYGQHEGVWRLLAVELAKRRRPESLKGDMPLAPLPLGMEGGRVCLILGERDPIVVPSEWIEDTKVVIGEDGVDVHVVKGGHEIGISKGVEIASIATRSWDAARI